MNGPRKMVGTKFTIIEVATIVAALVSLARYHASALLPIWPAENSARPQKTTWMSV